MFIVVIAILLVGESAGRFSGWNTWSPCSVTCGNGMRSRERVSKFETCYSELSERKVCVNEPCVEHGNLTNVALGASVVASSVFLAAFPTGNIVDGDESTDFYAGTCTQTGKDAEPWLRIELNDTAVVKEVVVFNRGDCCSERLNQMEITVGEDPYGYNNTVCGNRRVMEGVKMARVPCYEYIKGSYIFVRIPGPQYLAICEVEVYGRFIHRGVSTTPPARTTDRSPTPQVPTTKWSPTPRNRTTTPTQVPTTIPGLSNLAVGKVANQSSTYYKPTYNYAAEMSVDGNLVTRSYTATSIAWWRVDLGKSAIIHKFRLYSWRNDFEYVANTNVAVGEDVDVTNMTSTNMTSCGMVTRQGGRYRREGYYAYDVTCETPLLGRYVQVNKNSDNGYWLYMRELEVYGRYI